MRHWTLLLALALAAGCTATDEQAEHACSHLDLAGDPVAAAASEADASTGSADLPITEHGVWRVEGLGGADRFIRVPVDQEVPTRLFLGAVSGLAGLTVDGDDEALPASEPNASCADEIPESYRFDMTPGDWILRFGSDAPSELWAMLVPEDHHH